MDATISFLLLKIVLIIFTFVTHVVFSSIVVECMVDTTMRLFGQLSRINGKQHVLFFVTYCFISNNLENAATFWPFEDLHRLTKTYTYVCVCVHIYIY